MDKELLRMQRLAGVITESQYIKKIDEVVNVGGMALGQTGKSSPDVKDQEASSASNEFLMSVRVSLVPKIFKKRNAKFSKIEVSKKEGEGEEKKGFFKKLGSKIASAVGSNSKIQLFFDAGASKQVSIGLQNKNGKFVYEDISEITKTLPGYITDESKQKLANFVKNQPEVKEAFPEIDKMIDANSFE
jgi:hypothetical protein